MAKLHRQTQRPIEYEQSIPNCLPDPAADIPHPGPRRKLADEGDRAGKGGPAAEARPLRGSCLSEEYGSPVPGHRHLPTSLTLDRAILSFRFVLLPFSLCLKQDDPLPSLDFEAIGTAFPFKALLL